MGNADRGARLESVLCDEIDDILRIEARDPALSSVQVTRVELSPGGARARVWWRSDDEDLDRVEAALERARGFVRAALAESLGKKKTPELVFCWDAAVATGDES